MSERAKCVILVPANYGIEPECERALVQLERRGYPVWRIPGFAAIDQCRNQLATDALARGFEELMWIDADIAFDPEAVDRLRAAADGLAPSPRHGGYSTRPSPIKGEGESRSGDPPLGATRRDAASTISDAEWTSLPPIVAGIYPKKGQRSLSSRLFCTTKEVTFGIGGGLVEILYAATGFLYTRREVYDVIQRHWNLPVCNQQLGKPMVPYFMPMVVEEESPSLRHGGSSTRPSPIKGEGERAKRWSYLAEDFSFSYRARAAGIKIYADTTIRLGHIGPYAFSWEEAGGSNQRFGTYIYRVLDAEEDIEKIARGTDGPVSVR